MNKLGFINYVLLFLSNLCLVFNCLTGIFPNIIPILTNLMAWDTSSASPASPESDNLINNNPQAGNTIVSAVILQGQDSYFITKISISDIISTLVSCGFPVNMKQYLICDSTFLFSAGDVFNTYVSQDSLIANTFDPLKIVTSHASQANQVDPSLPNGGPVGEGNKTVGFEAYSLE